MKTNVLKVYIEVDKKLFVSKWSVKDFVIRAVFQRHIKFGNKPGT